VAHAHAAFSPNSAFNELYDLQWAELWYWIQYNGGRRERATAAHHSLLHSLEMEKSRRNRQSHAGSSDRQSAVISDQIGFGWRVEEGFTEGRGHMHNPAAPASRLRLSQVLLRASLRCAPLRESLSTSRTCVFH
jgi:hypothetical protein